MAGEPRGKSRRAFWLLITAACALTVTGMTVVRHVLWLGLTIYGIGGACGLLAVIWPLVRSAVPSSKEPIE